MGLAVAIFPRDPYLITQYGCKDIEGVWRGITKVIDGNEGDHFNEITFKGGIT